MDLLKLVTQDNATQGKWFRVELYGKKQDFAIKILGSDSDVVKQYEREQLRALSKNGITPGKMEFSDEALQTIADNENESVACRMIGIAGVDAKGCVNEEESITLGDVIIENKKDCYIMLLQKIPALKDFVLKKSGERANFLD